MADNMIEINETDDDIVIGIDLGTRFSCVSIWRNKRLEIIPDQYGNRTIPSVVSFYGMAKLTGHNALSMKDVDPLNTIYDIKRIIGRKMDDPAVKQVKKLISYQLIDDNTDKRNILVKLNNDQKQNIRKLTYRPEEICASILQEIKTMCSQYLKKEISKAIITVPAYFNDSQRQATLDSAKIANLDIIKIINEPTAAALAYGMGGKKWKNKNGGNVIIYDLGAGTLDVSLMNISNGVFHTLAVSGNTHLGGEDIDYLLMSHILINFQKQNKIVNFEISKLSKLKLKNSVENAKKILSTTKKALVCVDDFWMGKKLCYSLTRKQLENICNEIFIMCIKPLSDVLESSGIKREDIDEVILVGGSTRVPKIQELVLSFFKDTKIEKLTTTLNPDEVVSAGAAIYGYIMTHQNDPFSENLMLLDITPLSLGIETLQKQMTVIIPRNTVIPTKKIKFFTTDTDYQDSVSIKIYEGERKLTKNNYHVGTFELAGFTKGPRGYPKIKITFHIDINGILQVTAHETKSNVQNTIKITSTWGAKGRLSKEEIDAIISEANKYIQIDTMYSLKISLIHEIKATCNTIINNLEDKSFNITKADKKNIRKDIKNNLKWLKSYQLSEVPLDELQKRKKRLVKVYTLLALQFNENNNKFTNTSTKVSAAEVFGDDDEVNDECEHQKIQSYDDPLDYQKEEINAIKNTIMDLCKNISSIVNNPVSKINNDDATMLVDYLDSVRIWLWTTSSNTTIEFVSKINEINNFTENIMKKYSSTNIFERPIEFTAKEELAITCNTLNTCIKSNYFSLGASGTNKLSKKISETQEWLIKNPSEPNNTYIQKIKEINDLCNVLYQEMNIITKNNKYDSIDTDDSTESDDKDISKEKNNIIDENIDNILEKIPKKKDVLLKIDINKFNTPNKLKYRKCVA